MNLADNTVKFEIPIYNGDFWIVFADNFIQAGNELGIELRFSANNCNALSLKKQDSQVGTYIIFIKNDMIRPDIIAHESLHIANYIFEDRGVQAAIHNDEHQAYLMDWVVEKSFTAAYNLNKQIILKIGDDDLLLTYSEKKNHSF